MTALHSGNLRQRIRIERELPQASGGGSYVPQWSEVANLWAQIEALTGREQLQGERLESRVTHRIILRERYDVTAGMRVLWNGTAYSIQAVMQLGVQQRFTQLLVSAGGAT